MKIRGWQWWACLRFLAAESLPRPTHRGATPAFGMPGLAVAPVPPTATTGSVAMVPRAVSTHSAWPVSHRATAPSRSARKTSTVAPWSNALESSRIAMVTATIPSSVVGKIVMTPIPIAIPAIPNCAIRTATMRTAIPPPSGSETKTSTALPTRLAATARSAAPIATTYAPTCTLAPRGVRRHRQRLRWPHRRELTTDGCHRDEDGDGHGTDEITEMRCACAEGWSLIPGDCLDRAHDPTSPYPSRVNPGAGFRAGGWCDIHTMYV